MATCPVRLSTFGGFRVPRHADKALTIITEAQKQVSADVAGVAITYSANYGQTVKIHDTYQSGGWNTQTGGGNQATVMAAMETLMGGKFSSLQHLLEIAPITTMTYSDYGGQTQEQVLDADLNYIKALLDKGWAVLGWQNQDSVKNPNAPYAIGNGISGPLPQKINDLIQTTLAKFAVDYPASH